MPIDTSFIKLFIKATEKAAYGAYLFKGKGDKNAADKSAVDMMRTELNSIKMHGKVVIGEGELDEAPMLYIGETLGKSKEPKFDIAVDPLEGTKFCAQGLPNAFAVMAVSETGNLLSAPDTYMEKIVIGPNLPKGLVDLDYPIEKNIDLLANAKNVKPSELTACVLDRPRHSKIIEGLKKKDVKINFISDGDVSGAFSVVDSKSKNDLYVGIGGGPEGVLAAAAIICLGGQMQTRLVLTEEEKKRAAKLGVKDFNKKYSIEEMIKGDVIFCATAVTDGDLIPGIKDFDDYFEASTLVLHRNSNYFEKVTNKVNK